MTLDQLRIFVVVAEHEHMTRASYALDMVQSAVSKAIAALEGEMAIRLFDRVGRNIRLTPLGAEFRVKTVELLDHAERLQAWTQEVGTRVERMNIANASQCRPCVTGPRSSALPTVRLTAGAEASSSSAGRRPRTDHQGR